MGSIAVEEPVQGSTRNVLDLPQIYTKPDYITLLDALISLKTSSLKTGFTPIFSSETSQERAAIAAYLTQIISCGLSWLDEAEQERILEEASLRLSERSGRTAMPSMTRLFQIPTGRGSLSLDIHEPSMTGDDLGLKTWGSAYVLASRLEGLGAKHCSFVHDRTMKVLELGSGTGLVGLAAAAVWQCSVALTDQRDIIPNTSKNAELNRCTLQQWGGSVSVDILDWNNHPATFPLGEEFDVVLAADPLYDPAHAQMLTRTITRYLSSSDKARVIIELPLRDDATRRMAITLRDLMIRNKFTLLDEGVEEAFDDWETGHETSGVTCWWGVWGR